MAQPFPASPSKFSTNDIQHREHDEGSGSKRVLAIDQGGNAITPPTRKTTDGRVAIDVEASAIASKQLVDFHSDDAAQRLGANAYFIASPDRTRSTFFDLDGYLGVLISSTDNSPGALGGIWYLEWSRDGVSTAYNDPGDGSGLTNFHIVNNTALVTSVFVPKRGRYVRLIFLNNAVAQGSTYPQVCVMDVTAYPSFFTNGMTLSGNVTVVGDGLPLTAAFQPVPFGGPNVVDGSSGVVSPVVVSALGEAALKGLATSIASGAFLLVANRGNSTASPVNVSEAVSSTQLAAAATGRRGFTVFNDTANPLYLKYGTAASTTSFTVKIAAGISWNMPDPLYTGVVHGISSGTGGAWRVTTW